MLSAGELCNLDCSLLIILLTLIRYLIEPLYLDTLSRNVLCLLLPRGDYPRNTDDTRTMDA